MKNKKKLIIYILLCIVGAFINNYFVSQEFKYVYGFIIGYIGCLIIGGE